MARTTASVRHHWAMNHFTQESKALTSGLLAGWHTDAMLFRQRREYESSVISSISADLVARDRCVRISPFLWPPTVAYLPALGIDD